MSSPKSRVAKFLLAACILLFGALLVHCVDDGNANYILGGTDAAEDGSAAMTNDGGGPGADAGNGGDAGSASDGSPSADGAVIDASPPGTMLWAATFFTDNQGTSAAADGTGNSFSGGAFSGAPKFGSVTLDAGGGGDDGYVAKLTADGGVVWATQASSASVDIVNAVAVNSNGDAYVTGAFAGPSLTIAPCAAITNPGPSFSGFIAKLDKTDGHCVWSIPLQSSGTLAAQVYCAGVAIHDAANLAFTCAFRDTVTYGAGTPKVDTYAGASASLVGVLNATNGQVVWSDVLSGAAAEGRDVSAGSPDIDSAGNVYVGGGLGAAKLYDRGTLINNASRIGSNVDALVVKLANGGGVSWTRVFGSSLINSQSGVGGVRLHAAGSALYVGGSFSVANFDGNNVTATGGNMDNDVFIVKLDTAGNTQWKKTFGTSSGEILNDIDIDTQGHPVAVGAVSTAGLNVNGKSFPAGRGFYVMKLDPASAVVEWVSGRTNGGDVFGSSTATTSTGRSIVVGQFVGTIDFTTTVSAGDAGIPAAFAAAFAP